MKPYYQDQWTTIYLGDCRSVIPELPTIDMIASDPPYGLNYNNGDLASVREKVFQGKENGPPRPIVNDSDEKSSYDLLSETLRAIKLRRGSCCCCCCGGGGPKPLFARWTLLLDEIWNFKQAVVWDKGGLGMGIHFRRNYEFVLIAQNGEPCRVWNGGNKTANVWRIAKIIPSEREHPTVKPVALMEKCIELFSNPGDLVLDPFMGSGTTLVAAKNLNRKAIGIEIDERFAEIAARRLGQEVFDFGGTAA